MATTIVRYKVKADRAEENKALIRKVFAELAEAMPDGLSYASFNLEDGVSFLHVATIDTPDGANPLTATPAFKAFVANIRDRCEEPPAATSAEVVGSYRFF
jgi:hypothetical protein